MATDVALLAALFFAVAVVYASVGFGGGSAYLALLTLAAVPLAQVAPVALVCNLIVVSGGSWHFVRAGHFETRLLVPFLVTSVPAAYLGGRYRLDVPGIGAITAVALVLAAAALLAREAWSRPQRAAAPEGRRLWLAGPVLGAALGGLSGVIGIGGGIFLAPVLHLLRWGTAKQVATVASLFILVNSAAGLVGQASQFEEAAFLRSYALLFVAVLAGGQLGSRVGAWRLPEAWVRRLTAGILLVAAANLLLRG